MEHSITLDNGRRVRVSRYTDINGEEGLLIETERDNDGIPAPSSINMIFMGKQLTQVAFSYQTAKAVVGLLVEALAEVERNA